MKIPFALTSRIAFLAFSLILFADCAPGQVTTLLHNFGDGTTLPNTLSSTDDATSPGNSLVQGRDGNFYGVTASGGTANEGTAFMMTPAGVVTILHHFGVTANDGMNPSGALIQGSGNDNNFYGTTANGGVNTNGTAFAMTPQGAVTILHSFGTNAVDVHGNSVSDAIFPEAALVQGTDGKFYGTTMNGGANGVGTVFSMTSGGVVTILHSFDIGSTTDGAYPTAPLIQAADGKYYGTASNGGANGFGAIFSITSQGTFALLHSCNDPVFNPDGTPAPADGNNPSSGLVQGTDLKFYGTMQFNGDLGEGVVYSMTSAGVVTILHSFGTGNGDGGAPTAGLVEGKDGNFYGTTSGGNGSASSGVVFKITPAGVETVLHTFGDGTAINPDSSSVNQDGTNPVAGLVLGMDGNFYGVTANGGTGPSVNFTSNPDGTVFKVAIGTPSLVSAQSFLGTKGFPVSFQVNATNSPTGFAATGLPAGLSINVDTGLISGIPTATSSGEIVLTLTNAAGSNTVLVSLAITDIVLTPGGTTNVPLQPPTPTQGFPPNLWTISPLPLPPNLTFESTSGTLRGTPTMAGNFSFVVTAIYEDDSTDPPSQTIRGTQAYAVVVPATFTTWAAAYPNAPTANVATGTPEHDGIPNLVKYLCDIDPSHPMKSSDRAALPILGTTIYGGVPYITLTYRQYALETGLTVTLQTSGNLKTWQTVTPGLSQQVDLDPVTGDPIMQLGIQNTGGTPPFLRLEVTSP